MIDKLFIEQIGKYKGLEVWVTNEDYWVTKEDIAVHSFGWGSGKNRIFIRKEAYDIIKLSSRSSKLLQMIYNHEYKEFLKHQGLNNDPHKKRQFNREQKLIEFLKSNNYFL